MFGYFYGLDNSDTLSVFRHDHEVVLCLSWSVTVPEWPVLILMFWEIVRIQQETGTCAVLLALLFFFLMLHTPAVTAEILLNVFISHPQR